MNTRILIIGSLLSLVHIYNAYADHTSTYTCQVIDVCSGDTVLVTNRVSWGGTSNRIQGTHLLTLAQLMAPYKDQPDAVMARTFLRNLLEGRQIIVVEHWNGAKSCGAWVFLNDGKECVNLMLIENGMVWQRTPELQYSMTGGSSFSRQIIRAQHKMKQSQDKARQMKIGIWTNEAAIPPWEWKAPQEKTPAEQNKK